MRWRDADSDGDLPDDPINWYFAMFLQTVACDGWRVDVLARGWAGGVEAEKRIGFYPIKTKLYPASFSADAVASSFVSFHSLPHNLLLFFHFPFTSGIFTVVLVYFYLRVSWALCLKVRDTSSYNPSRYSHMFQINWTHSRKQGSVSYNNPDIKYLFR
jgi:hypothetical protein